MKKVLFALVMVLALAGCSFAEHRVGVLERIKLSPEKLAELIRINTQIFSEFSNNPQKPAFKFYRSLNEMVLALNAGDIDEVTLPEAVADYILSNNPEYFINCLLILRELRVMLSFGFKDDRRELAESFNKALREMKQDGTLAVLQSRYIHPDSAALTNADTITPPVFRKFEDAPTIRAAVTGDLPPIDYIAADGKPEGFIILDYKTNANLQNDYNRKYGKMLREPFNCMPEEDLSLYSIQLSLYALMLQDVGIPIIARCIVWLKDSEYEIIPVPDLTETLRQTL